MLESSSQLNSVVLFFIIFNLITTSTRGQDFGSDFDDEDESAIIFEYPGFQHHTITRDIRTEADSRNQDQDCMNENITPGKCVEIINCPPALQSIRVMKKHNFKRCGFHGKIEIICCPNKYVEKDSQTTQSTEPTKIYTRNPFLNKNNTETGHRKNTTSPNFKDRDTNNPRISSRRYKQVCEEYSNEIKPDVSFHIIEGEDADPKEFPHMAALGYRTEEIGGIQWECGGSLISRNYVLTAAHCIINAEQNPPFQARLGSNKLNETNNEHVQIYNISNITVHPGYNRFDKINDIALIKLSRKVTFDDFVRPACLYDKNDDPTGMIITGWGSTEVGGESSNILQKAKLTAVSLQECNTTYSTKASKSIGRTQICAEDKESDTCQGDSGGPLQVQNIANSSVYSIVGVTSYGIGCGGKYPGIYTRVSSYLDWIEKIVWDE